MKIAIISFTKNGCRYNQRLCASWKNHDCEGYAIEKYREEFQLLPVLPNLSGWTGRMFQEKDAILFIGAAGIAVRCIAPFVKSKKTDPAVLVMDERATFVISLLSGHIGGANELALEAAEFFHAQPVITTATDVNHKFAVDVFAVKNQCEICEMDLAKEVAANLVEGKKIGFCSRFPVEGTIPKELDTENFPELGICIGLSEEDSPYQRTLHLIPKIVTVGIGCKKQTPCKILEEQIFLALKQEKISKKAVFQMASIDLKAQEAGILQLVQKYHWKYQTFSAEDLAKVEGTFSSSGFVKQITGIDNVCERSAVLAGGTMIQKKRAENGVTTALAEKNWRAVF